MLWKTMYSLFRELPNEQQMYQAIAMVGNILLKLGAFGRERQEDITEENPSAEVPSGVTLPSKETSDSTVFSENLAITTAPEVITSRPEVNTSKSEDDTNTPAGVFTSRQEHKINKSEGIAPTPEEVTSTVPRIRKTSRDVTNIPESITSTSEGVTISSELETSTLLKEALLEAARSESSIGSPVQSSTGEDFILVASDDGFSTPEAVGEYGENAEDTLQKVFHKLHVESAYAGQCSADKRANSVTRRRRDSDIKEANSSEFPTAFEGLSSEGCSSTPRSEGNKSKRPSSGALDPSWSISFEQFLASMLTEPYLVYYFEDTVDITERLKKIKTEGLGSFQFFSKSPSSE